MSLSPDMWQPGLTMTSPTGFCPHVILERRRKQGRYKGAWNAGDYVVGDVNDPKDDCHPASYAALSREPVEGEPERAMRVGSTSESARFLGNTYEWKNGAYGWRFYHEGQFRFHSGRATNLRNFAPLAPAAKGDVLPIAPDKVDLIGAIDRINQRVIRAFGIPRACPMPCVLGCFSRWTLHPGSCDPCPSCGEKIDAHVPPIDQSGYEGVNEAAQKSADLHRLHRRGLDEWFRRLNS